MNYRKIILSVIFLVFVVVCLYIVLTGKIIKIDELLSRFVSAFFGAIIMVVVNYVLKNILPNTKKIKKRNEKIYKKKSKIYEKLINRLNKVLQEKKINANTFKEILFEINSIVVFYINKKSLQEINNNLKKLAECIGIGMDEKNISAAALNDNINNIEKYIYSIINILNDDLGNDEKKSINNRNDLERETSQYYSDQILLEEIDNTFMKKNNALFEGASYDYYKDGFYIIILIKGKESPGGRIEIGPFNNNNQENKERLIFRLLAPPFNHIAKPYVSDRVANVEGNYINFYHGEPVNDDDQIDLTFFEKTKFEWLKKNGFNNEDIYKDYIYQFGFDEKTYNRYGKIYVNLCKSIAARAYYYFFNTKTDKDNIPIKELCEKFGEVTNDEIIENIAERQGIDLKRK